MSTLLQQHQQTAVVPSLSPLRKRTRAQAHSHGKTKLSSPPPRRLRMRIDHSDRIWAGRCGCKSPNCMADEFEFSSSDTATSSSASSGESDNSEEEDEEDGDGYDNEDGHAIDCEDRSRRMATRCETDLKIASGTRAPPQDPDDLVPMLLHLMLMM